MRLLSSAVTIKQGLSEKGLIIESLMFFLFFTVVLGSVFYIVTRNLDQSISSRQSLYDQERGSFYTELPVLQFTAAGLPVLRSEAEVKYVLESAQKVSSLHSIVGLPFCAAVIDVSIDQITNNFVIKRIANYHTNCESLSSAVPACVDQKLQQFLNRNKSQEYYIMGFYVANGEPFEDQCAVARAVAHEVEPPIVVDPSYYELPSQTPSQSPSLSPTPSTTPTIEPSLEPSVQASVEISPEPSLQPSPDISLQASPRPSYTPSLSPSLLPSLSPSLAPSPQASINPSPITSAVPPPTPSPNASLNPPPLPSIKPSAQPPFQPSRPPPPVASSAIRINSRGGS